MVNDAGDKEPFFSNQVHLFRKDSNRDRPAPNVLFLLLRFGLTVMKPINNLECVLRINPYLFLLYKEGLCDGSGKLVMLLVGGRCARNDSK
jgi:hypothetical protein